MNVCAFVEACEPADADPNAIAWRAYEPPVTSPDAPVVDGSLVKSAR